jgi:hypothetical protein
VTEDELYTRVINWLRQRSGLDLIIRDSLGKPRPTGSYGMINLIRSEALHEPVTLEYETNPNHVPVPGNPATELDPPFVQVPVIEWEWTFSFNIYAASGSDAARKVASAASILAGVEGLLPFIIHRTSAIRRLPESIGEGWEDRIQMDLFIRGLARDGVPVDVAEIVTARFEARTNRNSPTPDPVVVGSTTVTKPV